MAMGQEFALREPVMESGRCATSVSAVVYVVDDRIKQGTRPNKPGARAECLLTDGGLKVLDSRVISEADEGLRQACQEAIDQGVDLLLTVGATGLRRTDIAPDVSRMFMHREIPHLTTEILLRGRQNTAKAALSRATVGVHYAPERATLIVNRPSSSGGIADCLGVIIPLLPSIFEQLKEA